MPDQSLHSFELDNGLAVLVEEMPDVQSAAFSILFPGGAIHEPQGKNGTAAALCDLMTRGAGGRNSRELSAALDNLGLQRNENVGWNFLSFSGTGLAGNVLRALPIYADIIRRPTLEERQFPAVLSGIEQSLLAEEDEPQRKVLTELRRDCYDSPWNRPTDGSLSELENIAPRDLVEHYQRTCRGNGAIIGVAGKVDVAEVRALVEKEFGGWPVLPEPVPERVPSRTNLRHMTHDSAQTHIGLAYNAVPYGHADYYAAWAAVSVLSGGSSSRLFTEVRENRGLCYSVYATLNSLLEEGRVLAYAGTTTERAQETLDVMLSEMRKLGAGVTIEELNRCRARAKSALVMQQESTSARAASLCKDWFHLHRLTTLAEVRSEVEAVTIDQIVDYAQRYPAEDITLLTIGAEPLTNRLA